MHLAVILTTVLLGPAGEVKAINEEPTPIEYVYTSEGKLDKNASIDKCYTVAAQFNADSVKLNTKYVKFKASCELVDKL